MIVYSPHITERLKYTLEVIFKVILNCEYALVSEVPDKDTDVQIINYSSGEYIKSSMQIIPNGLLHSNYIKPVNIPQEKYEGLPCIFYSGKGDFPFDVFSAVFFMVSRFEEYLPFVPDEHGRFRAEDSFAFRNGFHTIPIVELWVKLLAKKLKINFPEHTFNQLLTIDIDNAWKYKNKGFLRVTGGLLSTFFRMDFKELGIRISVLSGKEKDPADTFSYILKKQENLKLPIQFFILGGRRSKFDKAISLKNKNYRKLLHNLYLHNKYGLHPTYESNYSFKTLSREYYELCAVLTKRIDRSRQHFLKFTFPDTFRNLIKLGIREEHSLGWSSKVGFRAGISRPFPFYDLELEKQTHLMLVPFVVMDRTLKDYMNLNTEESKLKIKELIDSVRQVGGQFTMLWHNDSLNDKGEWQGWKEVFEWGIDYANQQEAG
ncbi:MAG: polysaccharide deacetylase family protein [Bacteroidales bacterium]|nr:polysaccharide deacetylase family protein [Bacteroidales bacterium]MBN2821532.1 polysaccharide deacetylase family protein [Bacteroidales bacterium]